MPRNLQVVGFRYVPHCQPAPVDFHYLCEVVEILPGKFQVGLGQENVDEGLRHLEAQLPLGIGDTFCGYVGGVLGNLNTLLSLPPALEGVSD